MNHFTMNVANVGDTEAVLCRRGEATMLTKRFIATHDRDECQRICQLDGMITEVGI
jgi:serine/threonine protein phosphatase PrpC